MELYQCVVHARRQNSRHHCHPNRNTRATIKRHTSALIGERQETINFVCHAVGQNRQLLPVYGVGTRLRNVARKEVMSANRLCIPATNVSMPSQPLILVETASIRRLKTDSSSRESLDKTFAISVMSCFENVVPRYFPNNVSFWIFVPVILVHNSVQPSLMNQFSLHKCRILNMRNICVWWNVSSQSF